MCFPGVYRRCGLSVFNGILLERKFFPLGVESHLVFLYLIKFAN
jgi:hypothetical protein